MRSTSASATDPGLRAFLDEVFLDLLSPSSVGLAASYALLAVAHELLLDPALARALALLAVATAVAMLGVHFRIRRMPARHAHPVGAGVAGLTLLNSTVHLLLAGDPVLSTNHALVMLMSGAFLLDGRWLAGVVAASLASFVVGWALATGSGPWGHFAFLQLQAAGFAWLLYVTRLRAHRHLYAARSEEARRQRALERSLEALARSEERFHRLVEASSEGILVHRGGRVVDASSLALALLGRAREEVVGAPLRDVLPGCEAVVEQQRLGPFDGSAECEIRRPDGSGVPVEAHWKSMPFPVELATVLTLRDVRERKRIESELREAEARKAAVLRAALDGIVGVDAEGRVLDWNPAAESLFGFRRDAALGRRLAELVLPVRAENDPEHPLVRLVDGDDGSLLGRRVECSAVRADGRSFPLELAALRTASGDAPQTTLFLRDLTERREMERLREELVATVSHELRTPLTSLIGFAELLLRREFAPERQRKFIGVIHAEGSRLRQLIDDLLDAKRVESGRLEPRVERFEVVELLREAELLFRSADGRHPIALDLEPRLTGVAADPEHVRRILRNLLGNAIKFSPHGGAVTLGARAEGEEVRIFVRDEGLGMPADGMARLFERFHRIDDPALRAIGGTGLGLSIVKALVEANGGRVWAESESGRGSTFHFTLPAAPGAARVEAAASLASDSSLAVSRSRLGSPRPALDPSLAEPAG